MITLTPQLFEQRCLASVGRFTLLSPADIEKATGRKEKTILNDKAKGLIDPLSNTGRPRFDGLEVYMYLVRIKMIELPGEQSSMRN